MNGLLIKIGVVAIALTVLSGLIGAIYYKGRVDEHDKAAAAQAAADRKAELERKGDNAKLQKS
jgi:hypothetical protein